MLGCYFYRCKKGIIFILFNEIVVINYFKIDGKKVIGFFILYGKIKISLFEGSVDFGF